MYYVYILRSKKTRKLYKGSSNDLRRRVDEHNRKKVFSTRAYVPWRLIYYEAFANKNDALREELFLKSGKGRERIQYLLKHTLINN